MRLIHYSNAPCTEARSALQTRTSMSMGKPRGLWCSVEGEDDWPSWCLAERFGLDRLTHVHDVALSRDANIIHLASAAEIDGFTERYTLRTNQYGYEVDLPYLQGVMDWPGVASGYQGIIIAPYVRSRRLHEKSLWYYGWDCACACIWDASAIESITLREVAAKPVSSGEATSGHAIDHCQRIIDTYLPRRSEVALGGIEAWERQGDGPRVVRIEAGKVRKN